MSSSRHPFPSWYTCISWAIRWTLLNFDTYLKISQLLKWCLYFALSFLFHVCLLLFKLFVVYCNMLLLSPFVVCYELLLLLLFVVNCLNVVVGGGAAVCCNCICQLKVICILLNFWPIYTTLKSNPRSYVRRSKETLKWQAKVYFKVNSFKSTDSILKLHWA